MNDHEDPLRQAMRGYAARLAFMHPAPPVSLVLFRAERRRRQLAIERAERPLRIMQIVCVVGVAFAAAWMLWRAAFVHARGAQGTDLLLMVCAGIVLIAGGCWTMLAVSRRPFS